MKKTTYCVLAVCIATSLAHGEIYFLTGAQTRSHQTERFGSSLFRIQSDGEVQQVAEISPQSMGTVWIGFSQEWRKIVVYSEFNPNTFTVIDFNQGAVSKACKIPPGGDYALFHWLANQPAAGQVIEWLESGDTYAVRGMVVDTFQRSEEHTSELQSQSN